MPQFPSAAHSGAYWPVRSQSSLLVAGGEWGACGAGRRGGCYEIAQGRKVLFRRATRRRICARAR